MNRAAADASARPEPRLPMTLARVVLWLAGLAFIGFGTGAVPLQAQTVLVPDGLVRGGLAERLDRHLTRAARFGFAGALLVAKDGEVILHKGYGLADRERRLPVTAQTV